MSDRTEEENKFEAQFFGCACNIHHNATRIFKIPMRSTIGAVYERNTARICIESDVDGMVHRMEIYVKNIDHERRSPLSVAQEIMARQIGYWSNLKVK